MLLLIVAFVVPFPLGGTLFVLDQFGAIGLQPLVDVIVIVVILCYHNTRIRSQLAATGHVNGVLWILVVGTPDAGVSLSRASKEAAYHGNGNQRGRNAGEQPATLFCFFFVSNDLTIVAQLLVGPTVFQNVGLEPGGFVVLVLVLLSL